MRLIDEKFKQAASSYVLQSLLATGSLMAILYFLEILTHAALVAALGATTFIVFAVPNNLTARPRRVNGGHLVGVVCGSTLSLALRLFLPGQFTAQLLPTVCAAALAVGLSIFLMTITNTEHPPAAGTALGLVAHSWTVQTLIFVLACASALSLVRQLLKHWLKDLV